ncbi:MAG: radical SAM family heme chaperone HemW [Desulfobacterales bacterium]|nr:radical SAM family heme chaperone HemW [Desulfobacterales bacterium]
MASAPAGIYLHIPFCERKCRYCDFYSLTDEARREDFMAAVIAEIRRRRQAALAVDSVYFGGGTPSLLPPAFYARVLEALNAAFSLEDDIEITLEANPGTVDAAALADYRRAGINRLNLGVQSFNTHQLAFLGRIHDADQARAAVTMARRAGFDNLGLDLIYGLPGQTIAAWQDDLERALSCEPAHLSCYALTYEPDTPLMADRLAGGHQPAGEEKMAALFEATADTLGAAGFEHYEISNFAADARHRSRHNLKYWTRSPYLGFGPAAHSFIPPRRSWNPADLEAYLARIRQGALAEEGREELTRNQEMIETVFLGLRLAAGIDLAAFARQFGTPLEDRASEVISVLVADGFLRLTQGRLVPTRRGMLLHDSVSARLTDLL